MIIIMIENKHQKQTIFLVLALSTNIRGKLSKGMNTLEEIDHFRLNFFVHLLTI